jgi:hypothetical protein
MTDKGFWVLLDEMGPQLPDGTQLPWSAEVSTIAATLRAVGFPAIDANVALALVRVSGNDALGEDFDWKITRVGHPGETTYFTFTPKSRKR